MYPHKQYMYIGYVFSANQHLTGRTWGMEVGVRNAMQCNSWHVYFNIHILIYINFYIYKYLHIRTYTYIHVPTHTHTHLYIGIRIWSRPAVERENVGNGGGGYEPQRHDAWQQYHWPPPLSQSCKAVCVGV